MGIVLLDTSVVIGLVDAKDALHERAVAVIREAQDDHDLLISIVSYAELLVGAYQDSQEAVVKLDTIISRNFQVAPLTPAVAHTGAELRAARSSLKLPDALIIATGIRHAAVQIITGDVSWREIEQTVRVI